ncbi:hypothetical protein I203_102284 [Kwoniella mangroviensis CBS 8507]|uniref:uncharacterized protein n=1 Tax=Kwoniella mangroviensis CBS 8507 TaxID=1296122 RepID=UPI00080D0EB1|nr:uncharacterized protein I203_03485 [Kwoniella mangroviensis CBS 8507]OCF67787.1 hypothetical protein I203_03485 [Kwoniella mangroviensis CBS 8507]
MSRPTTSLISRSARHGITSRSLFTSVPRYYSNEPELPPQPKSAEALGFKTQPGRQRQLPTDLKINISPSVRKDLFKETSGVRIERQQAKKGRNETKSRITLNPRPSNKNKDTLDINNIQEESNFFENSDLSSSGPSTSTPTSRKGSLKDVSLDVISESSSRSSLPPDVIRRQRRENNRTNSRQGQGQGQGQNQRNARAGSRRGASRDTPKLNAREKRVMLPRRQLTFEVADHSKNGLFGKNPLLLQSSKSSIINGLGHPRKTSSTHQSLSTPQFPSSPIPILSPLPSKSSEQAIQIASWTAALNGSIAPRVKGRLEETVRAQLGR